MVFYGLILLSTVIFSSTNELGEEVYEYGVLVILTLSDTLFLFFALIFKQEHYNRSKAIGGLFFVVGVSVLLAGLGSEIQAVVVIALIIARGGIYGVCCVVWIYTSEVYPTSLRGTAHSFANAWARLGAAIAPFIINLTYEMGFLQTAIALTCICGVGVFAQTLMVFTTAGKDLAASSSDALYYDKISELGVHNPEALELDSTQSDSNKSGLNQTKQTSYS